MFALLMFCVSAKSGGIEHRLGEVETFREKNAVVSFDDDYVKILLPNRESISILHRDIDMFKSMLGEVITKSEKWDSIGYAEKVEDVNKRISVSSPIVTVIWHDSGLVYLGHDRIQVRYLFSCKGKSLLSIYVEAKDFECSFIKGSVSWLVEKASLRKLIEIIDEKKIKDTIDERKRVEKLFN